MRDSLIRDRVRAVVRLRGWTESLTVEPPPPSGYRPDGLLVEDEVAEVLLRGLAERLSALRGVDPVKADAGLAVARAEDRDRVAVGHAHDPILKGSSGGRSARPD